MVSVCVRLCVVYIKTCVTVNKTMGLKHTVYSGLKVSNNYWTTSPIFHLCLDYNTHNPLLPPTMPEAPRFGQQELQSLSVWTTMP